MRFFDAIVRYETDLWTYAERALKESGAGSLADLDGLRAIHGSGEACRVHEVSAALGITIGAASKLVDRLERAGLALRRPNPGDGRSSFLALTADGEARRAEAEAVVERALATHLQGADADIPNLIRGLESLRASLADAMAVRS